MIAINKCWRIFQNNYFFLFLLNYLTLKYMTSSWIFTYMVRHIYVNVSCIPNSKSMKHDNAYILKNIVNNFCKMLRILKLQFLLKCKCNKIWKFFWISFLPPLVTFRLKKESKLNQSRLFSEENQNIIFHKRTGNSFYFLFDKALQTIPHCIF